MVGAVVFPIEPMGAVVLLPGSGELVFVPPGMLVGADVLFVPAGVVSPGVLLVGASVPPTICTREEVRNRNERARSHSPHNGEQRQKKEPHLRQNLVVTLPSWVGAGVSSQTASGKAPSMFLSLVKSPLKDILSTFIK